MENNMWSSLYEKDHDAAVSTFLYFSYPFSSKNDPRSIFYRNSPNTMVQDHIGLKMTTKYVDRAFSTSQLKN